jgi:TPR repeat protein
MLRIGTMYASGSGVKRDITTAFAWYKMAADAGFHPGVDALAFMYATGSGINKNLDEATRLYKTMEAEGDPSAALALRQISATGSPEGNLKINFSDLLGLNSGMQTVIVNKLTSTPASIMGHTIDVVVDGGNTSVYANSSAVNIPTSEKHKDLIVWRFPGSRPITFILKKPDIESDFDEDGPVR